MFALIGDNLDLLCTALRCSPAELYNAATDPHRYASVLAIPRRKKSRRPRLVWETEDPLRRLQRQIALWLKPHASDQEKCVTAFRDDGSAIKNAKQHCGKPAVLVADLADFYGSISIRQVVELFISLGAGRQVATTLGRLSTIDERLMQGGRASPFLANLVARPLDDAIRACLPTESVYTRYVDDITISGELDALPSEIELAACIADAGFSLRKGSFRIRTKEAGPYVTGLYVGGEKLPKAPQRVRRRIERFLHFAQKFSVESAAAMTFRRGTRASDPIAALSYVRGMAHWMKPLDEERSQQWLALVVELRKKVEQQ